MTNFNDLGLATPLLKALEQEGYQTPTPIQAQAIPALIAGRDLLGIAQTGTGKTAAFALPILHKLAADPKRASRWGARALVLAPTRELASQIGDSFETYGRHLNLRVAVVFGGVGYRPQREALSRGLDVLVATPGRLLDLMGDRSADLSETEVLVLDEADQMLDLGFIKPIRQIVAGMKTSRQNLLFSATMPREIAGLAEQLLRQPVKITITPAATTVERIAQKVIHVDQARKRALLAELLSDPDWTRTLVFTRTKRGADRVARHLEACGVATAAIHGNKSQNQREIALDAFRLGKIRALVATDIAARGIDVDEVSHVVNFELPEVPEAYVHRIGRTARAGASGTAVSLCAGDERDLLRAIERVTRQSIPSVDRRGDRTLEADVRREPEADPRGKRSRREPSRNTRHERAAVSGAGQERSGQKGKWRDRSNWRKDAGTASEAETRAALGRVRFLAETSERREPSTLTERARDDQSRRGSHSSHKERGRQRRNRGAGRPVGSRATSVAG